MELVEDCTHWLVSLSAVVNFRFVRLYCLSGSREVENRITDGISRHL
jgi:hypothetical protein